MEGQLTRPVTARSVAQSDVLATDQQLVNGYLDALSDRQQNRTDDMGGCLGWGFLQWQSSKR
jgi:hypothetical protein